MDHFTSVPRLSLGLYPTPLYLLKNISSKYGRNIYLTRDDLCGIALGGNKVRKLEFLLAQAKAEGCDTVFTTGGAQSNHAMLTAACAARLGMKAILLLKKRGVTEHLGNLVLNDIYGAEVRLINTDSYDDIYAEMERETVRLAAEGHRAFSIPCGDSNAMGTLGYANCVRELAEQVKELGISPAHIVSATGSGGTTAGLLLGARLYLPEARVTGIGICDDPFAEIVPQLVEEASAILGVSVPAREGDFALRWNIGAGYAIPNPADVPYMEELARTEGMLLDPVYTGKAWSGLLQGLEQDWFGTEGDIIFVHTGGAAALFAIDLPRN